MHEVLQLIQDWCRVNIVKGKVGGVPNGTRQCRYADWTKDSKASGDFPVVVGLGHPHRRLYICQASLSREPVFIASLSAATKFWPRAISSREGLILLVVL